MPGDDVLVLIDEGGRVIEWGRPAAELLGWSTEDALGQEVTALLPEVAAGDEQRREESARATPVLVKPLLRGTSVMWRVLAAGDAVPGRDLAVLKDLFAPAPVGLHVLDDRLRLVRASTARRGKRGLPVGHVVGRRFTEVFEGAGSEEETAVARGVLESGEPVVNRLVRGVRSTGRPGRRTHSVSYFRLEGPDGEVLGLVASEVDVTERENAQQRLALLDTVRDKVGRGLNLGAVCRELVEAAVPAFASTAVVEVIEDIVRGEEPPQVPVPQDIPLRRAAFAGPDPAYPVGEVRPMPADTPFSHVLADLRPRLLPIDDDTPWLAADPVRAEIIRRCGGHSLIVAPLVLHGRAMGVVSFYRDRHADPFEDDDLTVASGMCAHAALCIDNVTRYMREWVVARTVQRRLLSREPAGHPTLETAELHLPNPDGGGAWSDTIALPGARTALVVGEVTGEGITTAITMGLLRTAIHTLAAMDLRPDELLARLNDTATRLAAGYAPADLKDQEPLTASCTVAIYDPVDLTCTIARAGMAEPLAVFPDGAAASLPVTPGPPLAGPGSSPFPAATVDLPAGTVLAIGTTVVADQVLAPSGPLRPLLDGAGSGPLQDRCDRVAAAIGVGHRAGEPLMLLARTKALPRDRVLTRDLPADAEAAPIARKATRDQLAVWGVDEETASTTELIVSELVGNAVRHGAPPLRLRLILGSVLTCEVSDAATSAPHVQHARTVDENGRGLFILATLAEQWGSRYHPQGKTVWAEQSVGEPAEPAEPAAEPT
ncbi:PAS domain S-box-containing protein [Streptomyces sp. DvalAA-14]|uniref:SpoIIE family protein phosphatase n=1 Tax=unclassified Streptomyces TaxID=2593676 RepID=UPI00081B2E7D|nr:MULTISPECIES: SpoIIE family protein phosphatase [unclassified Streptomyces]MYS23758.1 SpoIIE family protein phosphatase [Streptomyces sp. SID4948]SCE38361.1 PAS domain S-box-containing protein [Streptomyces sp. DvalAA-14]